MRTYYYSGNYSLSLGFPFLIFSIEEQNNYYKGEVFIILDIYRKRRLTYGYLLNISKDDLEMMDDFKEFLLTCAQDEIYDILSKEYEKNSDLLNSVSSIELVPKNHTILALLNHKYPNELQKVRQQTAVEELKSKIDRYRLIKVNREDFDIDNN